MSAAWRGETVEYGLALTRVCGARRGQPSARGWLDILALAIVTLLALASVSGPAAALKPITLNGDQDWIDVSGLGEVHEGRGDALQIETAPGADGATARMGVRASTPGTNPNWLAFALHNPTNKVIELWLAADRYTPIGAGVVWPDLDARRVAAVAHSAGFAPERIRNDRVDVFRLTIERGQTVTFVAELASERLSRVLLWKPIEFEQRQRERQLFNGIMLGITGLLAVFLTAVFAANHKSIFPIAGLVAWCALGLLCVDFGFWHKLFQMKPEDNAQYRAAAEAALAASLVMFLAAFLRVNLWSPFARSLFVLWIGAQLAIIGVATLDPRLAATVARLSMGLIGGLGFLLILGLSLRRLDRALALLPTWILFLVWLFGAAVTLSGRMGGEFAISGLVSGLVLLVVLIGFTVTQYAFRSTEPMLFGAGPGGQQLRLAAMDRSGVSFWEWNVRRDELRVDAEIEALLGLGPAELPTKLDDFLAYVHTADRERFRLELLAIRERGEGTLHTGIRLRHADSSFRWLDFEGASIPTTDQRNLRCVGLVRDTTDQKRAQERLLHNAVYDSLTSLPNRELFIDRLGLAMRAAPQLPGRHVTVLFIDVDRFRSVNSSFGIVVGDSIILTISRRLARIAGAHSTLARIGGDQFALYLLDQNDPRELLATTERIRLSLRSPIRIAGQEIVLTGSLGVSIYDGGVQTARELLRDAEVAMHRAKRQGTDRAEIFSPEMQSERAERAELERDLATAIEQRRLTLLYQPIVSLSNEELVGFEAILRWQHPKLGVISPADYLPLADSSELAQRLGSYVIGRAITDIARWQQELPRTEQPLFVTVAVTSRQLISPELVQEVKGLRSRTVLPPGTLRLSIPEGLMLDNPEQASNVLELLKDSGIEVWMDRFASGYSSLAYLGRFSFEAFRLDAALVEWSSRGERDAALVRSAVAVAHELGRKIVGQGVETAEDASFLRSIGCQYAQGFLYGEAMGEAETVRLLRLIRKSERRMRRRGMSRGVEKKKPAEVAAETPPTLSQKSAAGRVERQASGPRTAPPTPAGGPPSRPTPSPPQPARPPNGQPNPAAPPTSRPVVEPVTSGSRPGGGGSAPPPSSSQPGATPVSRPLSVPPWVTAPPGGQPQAPIPRQAPPNGSPATVPPSQSVAPPRGREPVHGPSPTSPPLDLYPPLDPPRAPQTQPVPAAGGGHGDPATGSIPTKPPLPSSWRSTPATLSPSVAASLAKLAGSTTSQNRDDGERSRKEDSDRDDGSPGSGIKAAE